MNKILNLWQIKKCFNLYKTRLKEGLQNKINWSIIILNQDNKITFGKTRQIIVNLNMRAAYFTNFRKICFKLNKNINNIPSKKIPNLKPIFMMIYLFLSHNILKPQKDISFLIRYKKNQ
ncbi:hypothetical protein BpHYR1_019317 [Brachionus plicatilis]|uniref:Uncharacterized protein n=1 Tax=Brachionus plicatilis TaxID=10195 RepID=A0A3M7PPI2_BRAPC|nr:hypothetical protein BpHYR1_019317 [Brachionus plicatilis]